MHGFLTQFYCLHLLLKLLKVIIFHYTQASVSGASVKGLKGCKTLNKHPDPNNPIEGSEERSVTYFTSGNS